MARSVHHLLLPLCAVAVPAVAAGQDELEERVRAALQLARPALMEHLQAPTPQGGVLGLLCLAALHDGVEPTDPVLAAALAQLAAAELSQTYDCALRLMVAAACPELPDRDALAGQDCRELLLHRDGGGFGYHRNSSEWDLSNTQYAALGLRAAASLGVEVPRKVWSALADEVIDAQRRYGAFGYRAKGDDISASMTAAGICVLAICKQALARPNRTIPTLDKHIGRGWGYFAKYPESIGRLDERWSLYFHYGLERAGILCDVTEVGGVDWYRAGAKMLCDAQSGTGGWQTQFGQMFGGAARRGSPVDTAFAVLFLRRGFQKVAGPVTGPRTVSLAALRSDSSGDDVHECARGLVRRGKSGLRDVLLALRSDIEPRRRAAYLALQGIAGQDFGYDLAATVEGNGAALRKAELWYLENR